MHVIINRRPFALVVATVVATAFAACSNATEPDHEEEPEIAAVTVTSSAGGTVTVPRDGAQSGTLTLRANQANTLTITVLGANGNAEPVVTEHAAEFEIRLLQAGVVRFTSSNSVHPFVMTVTPAVVGTATYDLQVYSTEHDHVEFTRPLVVTVTQ